MVDDDDMALNKKFGYSDNYWGCRELSRFMQMIQGGIEEEGYLGRHSPSVRIFICGLLVGRFEELVMLL